MKNIYELTSQYLELQDMLSDEDVDPDVLRDTLEAIEGEYDEKIESYCEVIRNLESELHGVSEELVRFSIRKKRLQGNIDRLKKAMQDSMYKTGRMSAGGKKFHVYVKKVGGLLPVELDVPVEELPPELVKYKIEADNEAIRKYLDEGVASPWCHYGERAERLVIK